MLLVFVSAFGLKAQNLPFVYTPFTYSNVMATANKIMSAADTSFKLVRLSYPEDVDGGYMPAHFSYTDFQGHSIEIQITQTAINADPDLNKKGTIVIDRYSIIGYFPDVFKIYKTFFSPNANYEVIKNAGQAPEITKGKRYVEFTRDTGGWVIALRRR